MFPGNTRLLCWYAYLAPVHFLWASPKMLLWHDQELMDRTAVYDEWCVDLFWSYFTKLNLKKKVVCHCLRIATNSARNVRMFTCLESKQCALKGLME